MPEEFNLESCQRKLRNFYLHEKSKVHLLQWVPGDAKDMSSIFVDPLLIRKEDKKGSNILNNVDLVNLKMSEGQRANRVLVVGQGGTGKTTIADNIVYKWAKGSSTVLSEYTLVFVIAMHKIQDKNVSLMDLIFQQILPEDSKVSQESLKSYIDSHAEEIMFIFDGMDEDSSDTLKNTSSEITKILRNRKLQESCVILTTRPDWVNSLGDQLKNYTQVAILGYSPENIDLYIQKFFKGDKGRGLTLTKEIKRSSIYRSLASTPVLLLMMCFLWEAHQRLPTTKTQLLQNTFLYLWKIYKKKQQGDDPISDEESDSDSCEDDLTDLILKLGKVAMCGLRMNSNLRIVFEASEFQGDLLKLGCKVNLINKETFRSGITKKIHVKFISFLFQIYCMAVYLSKLLDTNKTEFDNCLQKILWLSDDGVISSFDDILDICCGTNPKAVGPCLKHIIHVNGNNGQAECDMFFHLLHIYESQLSHEQCKEFLPLYLNFKPRLTIRQTSVPSLYYIMKLHRASKHSLLSVLHTLQIETDFILWLPSLLKCTTKLKELFILHEGFNNLTIKSDNDKSNLTACFQAIAVLSCLETLSLFYDMSGNELKDMAFDVTNILLMLHENKVNLTTLQVLGFQFDFNTMAQLLSTCTSMSRLSLNYNKVILFFSEQTHPEAGEMMRVIPKLTKLSALQLTRIAISSDVKYLTPIVPQLQMLHLEVCLLHGINLTYLVPCLNEAKQLKELGLNGNPLLLISKNLTENFARCLEKLPQLEKLYLCYTGLNDECTCILAKYLKNKPTLCTLDIRSNPSISPIGKNALIRYDTEEQLLPVDWCFSVKCGNTEEKVPGLSLRRCTRCWIAKYCSKDCQAAHWKLHSKDCKARKASKE